MFEVAAGTLWGDWVMGDLVDSTRVVGDVLGREFQVASIHATAPAPAERFGLPTVTVTTRDKQQHQRLRHALVNSGWEPDHLCEPSSTHFSAVIAGLYLVLMVEDVT